MGRQRHRIEDPHGLISRRPHVGGMRARNRGRTAVPCLCGGCDAEIAWRHAARTQKLSDAGHCGVVERAGDSGWLSAGDPLDQCRHRNRIAKPEPSIRVAVRVRAWQTVADRHRNDWRDTCGNRHRADCHRRQSVVDFPAAARPGLGGWPTHSAMPRWRSFRLR